MQVLRYLHDSDHISSEAWKENLEMDGMYLYLISININIKNELIERMKSETFEN